MKVKIIFTSIALLFLLGCTSTPELTPTLLLTATPIPTTATFTLFLPQRQL